MVLHAPGRLTDRSVQETQIDFPKNRCEIRSQPHGTTVTSCRPPSLEWNLSPRHKAREHHGAGTKRDAI